MRDLLRDTPNMKEFLGGRNYQQSDVSNSDKVSEEIVRSIDG